MKAVLTEERFSDPDWIFERKLDGIRCVATKDGRDVRLRSRTDKPLGFTEVAEALAADPVGDVVLDGEVVAFEGEQTSFARLQQRHERPTPVFYYVFDVLRLGGEGLTGLPLRVRQARRRAALGGQDPLRFPGHRDQDRPAVFP